MFNLAKKAKPKAGGTGGAGGAAGEGAGSSDVRTPKDPLNAKRDREAARSRLKSAASREIGPIRPRKDADRYESCRFDLERFCLTYFPFIFYLGFSPAHRKAIKKLEQAILHGGLFALAMPRGSGKTTLTAVAAIWALLYGHRRFVVLIGATEPKAEQLLKTIKAGLQRSETLDEDFPEVCQPVRALENDARRCSGQIVDGKKTFITWGSKCVVLPTVEGSACSGSVVNVMGITGSIRGINHILPNGQVIRPDMVIPDDPQTRESAWSESQCDTRFSIMHGDVLGLAGPGTKIAAVCPCTVIRKGDLADRLLDREQSPEWQGERTRMLISLPTNAKRWEEYAQIRADSLRADGKGGEATEFYRQHRQEMDEGAESSWPERFNPDEISAIQNAMNLKLRDEDAFAAECQNEPREVKAEVVQLRPEDLCRKLSHLERGLAHPEAQKITAFIDVHKELLYWMLCAWSVEEMGGWVLDYGTYPEQPRRYFMLRQAAPSIGDTFPGLTEEAAIRKALESLCGHLFARVIKRTDGTQLGIDKLLIDQGYKPTVVHNFIRGKGSVIMPAKGVGIGAAAKPMSEYRRQPGEQMGTNWIIPKPDDGKLRHVRHDTNHWKSFFHSRLALPEGTKGAITLYGDKSGEHRLLGDHLYSEFGSPTQGHGRQLVEWRHRPGACPDNHLLDCGVGCCVGASLIGCGAVDAPPKKLRRPSHRDAVYIT